MAIQIGSKTATLPGRGNLEPYQYVDWLSASEEAILVQGGGASYVPAKGFNPTEEAALRAVVATDGNVTSAALTATSGMPGQVVRLSDGDNKGALLVWAKAAGATAYSWCWWLWPQAAYEG